MPKRKEEPGTLELEWSLSEEAVKDRLIRRMRAALRKYGCYEPAIDDLILEGISDLVILKTKLEAQIERYPGKASLYHAYQKIVKTIGELQNSLAISRKLREEERSALKEEFSNLIRRVYKRLEEIERRRYAEG